MNRAAFLRSLLAFLHDLAAAGLSWLLAFMLRFNFEMPAEFADSMIEKLGWVVPLQAAVFWRLSLYRGLWRYASLTDFRRILGAAVIGAMTIAMVLFVFQMKQVPRSSLVLYPILLVMLMTGSRIAYRAWKEGHLERMTRDDAKRTIVLGAGTAGARFLEGIVRSPDWITVGLLDDNATKRGREIHGVKVLGSLEDLPRVAETLGVDLAVIAMPGQSHAVRRRAFDLCRRAGVTAMMMPSYEDIASGRVSLSQLRPVEVDDLLGRDPVQLDASGLSQWIGGRVVLVTGAGGSIGSELCRQIARYAPSAIVLYETNEFALYTIEQEFVAEHPGVPIACLLGDVKDAQRLDDVLGRWKPAVVFHAAAYKHVPMVETGNAWAGMRNNVLGTLSTARAAIAHGVEKFVLVSTDKAVNPTSVMGTSKRLAEMVCQGLQQFDATRFVMVRFGNVLGSTGSVIPRFRQQIAAGGPVTVTHPEMTRYFMSIPEAAQLVLQAGLMGQGGEIFVLDMGEPVRITDLAREMIRLSGVAEDDVKIVFTGLRPGEKLYEEVLADGEATLPTPHPKLRIARSREVSEGFLEAVAAWLDGAPARDDDEVRAALPHWVPEYRPGGPGTAPLPVPPAGAIAP